MLNRRSRAGRDGKSHSLGRFVGCEKVGPVWIKNVSYMYSHEKDEGVKKEHADAVSLHMTL